MPKTKAYTSSHQVFWAENEQTCMTSLCFNCNQIIAVFAYRIVPTASKGPAFIKCEQELHWPMWIQQEMSQANELLWATPGSGEGFSTAAEWLPARKVVNRRVCSTLIWLYFSQDFKQKDSLSTSRSQKSIANSSKFHTWEKCHYYYIRGFSRKQWMQQHPETAYTCMSNLKQ